MCRLFGQIAPRSVSPANFLVDGEFSLLRQSSADPARLQKDGWGVGCFRGKEAVVIKSAKPAFGESAAFRAAAEAAWSTVSIAHIRAASNPRGLPERRILTPESAQPFTDGHVIFAHNGVLDIVEEVAESLGAGKKELASENDSEVYFRQFLKFYRRTKEVLRSLVLCVEEDWAIWKKVRSRHPGKEGPFTSLNALIALPGRLYSFCHSLASKPAGSLFDPSQPWTRMCFSRREDVLAVASEKMDGGPWLPFRPPELLETAFEGGSLRLRRRTIAPEALA